MRLKLLFFPISLVVVLVMIIWYIYPAWQENGKLKEELAKRQHDYNLLLERQKVLDRLVDQLNRNKEVKDFLLRYIPLDKDEEYVINAISDVAGASGAGLVTVNVLESRKPFFASPEKSAGGVPTINPPESGEQPVLGADGSALGTVVVKKKPLKEFLTEVIVIGTYDSIKKFLAGLNNIDRLHAVTVASVETVSANDETLAADKELSEELENAVPAGEELLVGKVFVSFTYSPSVVLPPKADSPVFHCNSLNLSEVDSIFASRKSAPQIDTSGEGRGNPFVKAAAQ